MSFLYYLCPTSLYGICAGDVASISSLSVYTGQYHLGFYCMKDFEKSNTFCKE